MILEEELKLRYQKMLEQKELIDQQEKKCSSKSKSLTENSENIEYKCPKCKDKEFIMLNDDSCIECDCKAKKIALKKALEKLKESGISDAFRKKRFDNFEYKHHDELIYAFLKSKKLCRKI